MKAVKVIRILVIWIAAALVISVGAEWAFGAGQSSADSAQTALTLTDCYRMAAENHPVMAKTELIQESAALERKNLNFQYLPRLTAEGRATYQSDVTEIDAELPAAMTSSGFDFPSSSRDQYRAELKVDQLLFDSGVTSSMKEMASHERDVSLKRVESDFRSIRERIKDAYFSIMLLQKQAGISKTITSDLEEQRKRVSSGVDHGVLKISDLQELESKILENEQRIVAIESDMEMLYGVLEELIGASVPRSAVLKAPAARISPMEMESGIERPELQTLALERKRLDAASRLTFRKNLPQLRGFATLGYGRPGLNMLSDQYDSYYMVGAYLSWNFFDWGINSRKREIQEINRRLLKKSEEALLKNIRSEVIKAEESILRYVEIVEKDLEIVDLREEIAEEKRARFENGSLTPADYISEINRLERARINMEKNRIELAKARVDYLMAKGEL